MKVDWRIGSGYVFGWLDAPTRKFRLIRRPRQAAEAHARLVAECLEELALMGFAAGENQRPAVQFNERWVSLSKSCRGDIHVILPRVLDGSTYGIHGEGRVQDRAEPSEPETAGTHMDGEEQRGRLYRGQAPAELWEELERSGFSPRFQTV